MIANVVTIARIYMRWAFRNPLTYIFMIIVMPFSILVPLLVMIPRTYTVNVIVGGMLFSVVAGGISDMSQNISFDRQMKRLTFFVTRPVSPFEYLIGMSIGGLSYNIVGSLLVLSFASIGSLIELSFLTAMGLLAMLVTAWLISSCIGFVIGLYGPRDYRLNSAIANMLTFAFIFLAPVYYPLDILPAPMRTVSHFVYTTHIALIMRNIITEHPIPWLNILATLVFLITSLTLSRAGIKWRTK